MSELKLYDLPLSQNGYKARLLLSILGLNYELITVDLMKGEQRNQSFLDLNPNGQIPTLADGENSIWESNAIISYLAKREGKLIPQDLTNFGEMVQWVMFEACKLQPNLQAARFMTTFQAKVFPDMPIDEEKLNYKREQSLKHLGVLDTALSKKDYLANEFSIADIACYAQVYPIKETGLTLEKFKNIQSWQKRIEGQPGYIKMEAALAA